MGRRASEERGALHELARIVAEGPHEVDGLLARACTAVAHRFSLDGAVALRVDGAGLQAVATHEFERPLDGLGELAGLPGRAVVAETDSGPILVVPVVGGSGLLGLIAGPTGYDAEPSPVELRNLTALGRALGAYVEQAARREELEATIVDLQRLDEAQTRFVSLASHELRTPISVVHGVAATLHVRGDQLTEDQRLDLRRLLFEQTSRLADLTNQLLDLSQIDAGAVRLKSERFSPRERFETLLPRLAPERLGDVEIEIDPELEIVTDSYAFERVVSNLVVNALRYGTPPVTVRVLADPEFRLEVEDCGGGIDPELVPRLFERFTRGERARSSGPAGAGLGLSIASSFASALGGNLGYEPGEPAGARFVLTLPRSLATADELPVGDG